MPQHRLLAVSVAVVATLTTATLHVDNLHLLQVASIKGSQTMTGVAKKQIKNKGKQCPPKPVEKNFGCSGQAQYSVTGTRMCSFWGEPHISRTFGTKTGGQSIPSGSDSMKEVSYETGLFRMARAVDNSWEVQVFSCGMIVGAVVAKFGNTTIEVVSSPDNNFNVHGEPEYLVNGIKVVHAHLPGELPGGSFLGPHDKLNKLTQGGDEYSFGSCADDPRGQVRLEISSRSFPQMGNLLNVLIEVAEGSYADGPDEEQVSTCPGDHWLDAQILDPSESLFTTPGDICAACHEVWKNFNEREFKAQWVPGTKRDSKANPTLGKTQCEAIRTMEKAPSAEEFCQQNGISMEHANQACDHLKGKPLFFQDCVYDVCSTGSDAAAANAEAEEEEEEPEPKCIDESADCAPQDICCDDDASRGMDFTNVVQNNLDGSAEGPNELRYGSVIDGIDLVITAPGYTSRQGNAANGARGQGLLAGVNVDTGTTQTFNFTFVTSGTSNPTSPGNAVLSFLDLDQGKKNKQRESVKICGLSSSPLVASNSELETTFDQSCATATSTGKGTGKDNPEDPAKMDEVQRARTIAFPLKGQSSISAELSVTGSGRQGRLFLFTGHPTVSCA